MHYPLRYGIFQKVITLLKLTFKYYKIMNDKDISSIENPMLRFEKIVENLNKSNKSMRVKRNELIFLKDYHNTSKTPCSDWLDHKRVDLYPINEYTEIPTNALDPGVWNIPEGYYAIEIRDLD